jgi:hypothetical protein
VPIYLYLLIGKLWIQQLFFHHLKLPQVFSRKALSPSLRLLRLRIGKSQVDEGLRIGRVAVKYQICTGDPALAAPKGVKQ